MQKFNAQSILALRDEPLKKDSITLKQNKGKENQKTNLMTNQMEDSFFFNLKESNKKKCRRLVLRREAEKSLQKDDDLLWDQSFISISSLSQVQSNENKCPPKQDSGVIFDIENNKDSNAAQENYSSKNDNTNQVSLHNTNEVTLGIIDEVIEICIALNRRPVKAAPIERLVRLESKSDFRFHNLTEVNYPAIGSVCLRLTSNLTLAACDLAKTVLASKNQSPRELTALSSSLQILNKVVSEAETEKKDLKMMIDMDCLKDLVKVCLNSLKNSKFDIKTELYQLKRNIQEEANKLNMTII